VRCAGFLSRAQIIYYLVEMAMSCALTLGEPLPTFFFVRNN